MASSSSSTFLQLLAISLLSISLHCSSASTKYSSSQTIASGQINFWAENIINQMPSPILAKLSPLSQEDTDFFTELISINDKFFTSEKFCSLAKLSCKPVLDSVTPLVRFYDDYEVHKNHFSHIKKVNADPFSFFRLSVLKQGNIVHLPNLQKSFPDRAFLSPKITKKISLSSINDIAELFPQSLVGATKEQIELSLSYCNAGAIKGETKSCPKSLEEMISFSKMALGGSKLISLASKSTKGSKSVLMINNIKQFKNEKVVVCHEIYLPFAAYFCHSISTTQLYAVDFVEPKTGAPVNSVIAICHMDTSLWPANHVAFETLKFGPGQGEACHWFSQIDLAWIASDWEPVQLVLGVAKTDA